LPDIVRQIPEQPKNQLRCLVVLLYYRLALDVDGECVLRYDNEAGKGDHRHAGGAERRYRFKSAEQLLADFWTDVDEVLR